MSNSNGGGKKLSAFDATMLVIGGIIGVGIFFTPQSVASYVPDTTVFVLLWVLGAGVAFCGAMTFAEWGGSLPNSGGWFVFLRESFGPFAAFLFAWVELGVVTAGSIAVIASIGAENISGVGSPGEGTHLAVSAAFIVVLTGLTICGIKISATVQNVCTITKLVAILALIVAGVLFFTPVPESQLVAPTPLATDTNLFAGAIAASLPVLFAIGGWQHLCYIAPQVRDPQRVIPKAILLGVACVGTVYVLVNYSYVRVMGIDGLGDTPGFAGVVAERTLGEGMARALTGAIAISAFGVCAVNIIVAPGIYVAMARAGLFFKSFGRVHPRTGAPVLALLTQGALSLAYLSWMYVSSQESTAPGAGDDSFRMNLPTLTESVVFAEWVFHGLVALGLILIRRRRPDLPRPFKSFLWPMAPVIYLAVACLVVFGNLYQAKPVITLVGLGVLGVGAAVYWPWRKYMRSVSE